VPSLTQITRRTAALLLISTLAACGGGGGDGGSGAGSGGGSEGGGNTGGGDNGGGNNGGSAPLLGAAGGSGIVILRHSFNYANAIIVTGEPNITYSNGQIIYKFTQSGTIQW
jgi:hypothetical protein